MRTFTGWLGVVAVTLIGVASALLLLAAAAPLGGGCLLMTGASVPENVAIDQVRGGYAEPFRCIATTSQGERIVMQEGPHRSWYALGGVALPIATFVLYRRYRRRQDIARGWP